MSEDIRIEGDHAHLTNGKDVRCSAKLVDWVGQVNRFSVRGLDRDPIPDNVKWLVHYGSTTVCIVELKPELRRIMWIRNESPVPFGPEATFDLRCLATPYVILKVPISRGRVLPRVEVFYRTEPLRALDGPGGDLFWCNLLNVSPHSYDCTAWFCTQYLGAEPMMPGLTGKLDAVVNHLWGGVFTRSSERHEGASAFSKAIRDQVDPRVIDVDRWEAESDKDPRFVLSVAWRPANVTVRDVIESELRHQKVLPIKVDAASLANHVIRAAAHRGTQ